MTARSPIAPPTLRPLPRLASRLVPLLALGSACAMDLPISERIADVRPLAVRVEVLDPFAMPDAAVRTEALPIETILVRPLFVDEVEPFTPERIEAEIEPLWLACPLQPIQGIFACLSNHLPLTLDAIEECPPVDLGALDPGSGELPAMPAPCRITGGTPSEPTMQVPLDFNFFLGGDLEITMIGHRPEVDATTEDCAAALLSEQPLSRDCLYTVQRASIGPNGRILRLAADAGFEGLDQLGPVPDEDQIADPDTNPRIQTMRVVVTDETVRRDDLLRVLAEGPVVDVARGDTLEVHAGQTLVIETTAPEEDLQTYFIPTDDDAYEERQESFVGDWFRTWGTLLSNDSDDAVSYNTWQMVPGEQDDAQSELPPDGRATLYYVLRDDRQGVDWWWFHVQVIP